MGANEPEPLPIYEYLSEGHALAITITREAIEEKKIPVELAVKLWNEITDYLIAVGHFEAVGEKHNSANAEAVGQLVADL